MRSYRTVWISDIHLGTKSCKAGFLLDFLESCEMNHLYLVGDIIDLWKANSGWSWSRPQIEVLRRFLRLAGDGVKVTYVPGNHDEIFREMNGMQFGRVWVRNQVMHETADGRKLLVLHGDQFDSVVLNAKWLAAIGSRAYDALIGLNNVVNFVRRQLGLPYTSFSATIKRMTKRATQMIDDFETILADYAKKRGADGVVCGHIHHAEMREMNGILYCNDGDWVESCTALVEHHDGTLEIVDWAMETAQAITRDAEVAEPAVSPV